MTTIDKIRFELKTIGKIIFQTSYNISCLEYIEADNNDKNIEVRQSYLFLNIALNAIWSTTILDLNKLLSQSQGDKFRLGSVINSLINNYKNIEWQHPKSISELQRLKNRLSDSYVTIEKIKTLRDKRIAHLDFINEPIFMTLDDIKPLNKLCQDIYNELTFVLTNSTTCWTYSNAELVHPIVISLAKYQQIKELFYRNLTEQNVTIKTEELKRIIRAGS